MFLHENVPFCHFSDYDFLSIEVEALKAELTEGNDQLKWLQERLEEIETQKQEAKNTIATAERILRMKQTSTRTEVFRLKGTNSPFTLTI